MYTKNTSLFFAYSLLYNAYNENIRKANVMRRIIKVDKKIIKGVTEKELNKVRGIVGSKIYYKGILYKLTSKTSCGRYRGRSVYGISYFEESLGLRYLVMESDYYSKMEQYIESIDGDEYLFTVMLDKVYLSLNLSFDKGVIEKLEELKNRFYEDPGFRKSIVDAIPKTKNGSFMKDRYCYLDVISNPYFGRYGGKKACTLVSAWDYDCEMKNCILVSIIDKEIK